MSILKILLIKDFSYITIIYRYIYDIVNKYLNGFDTFAFHSFNEDENERNIFSSELNKDCFSNLSVSDMVNDLQDIDSINAFASVTLIPVRASELNDDKLVILRKAQ